MSLQFVWFLIVYNFQVAVFSVLSQLSMRFIRVISQEWLNKLAEIDIQWTT